MQSFTIPPRSAVGYLDPEIAGEGRSADDVGFDAPSAPYTGPTYEELKKSKKYRHLFEGKKSTAFPAWIYNRDGTAKLVGTPEEAIAHGITFRAPTEREKNLFGNKMIWDYGEESNPWRAKPWGAPKFDPKNPGQGKIVVDSQIDNRTLLNSLTQAIQGMRAQETGAEELVKMLVVALGQRSPALAEAANAAIAEGSAKGAPKDVEDSGSGMLGAFAREHSNKREKRG